MKKWILLALLCLPLSAGVASAQAEAHSARYSSFYNSNTYPFAEFADLEDFTDFADSDFAEVADFRVSGNLSQSVRSSSSVSASCSAGTCTITIDGQTTTVSGKSVSVSSSSVNGQTTTSVIVDGKPLPKP